MQGDRVLEELSQYLNLAKKQVGQTAMYIRMYKLDVVVGQLGLSRVTCGGPLSSRRRGCDSSGASKSAWCCLAMVHSR